MATTKNKFFMGWAGDFAIARNRAKVRFYRLPMENVKIYIRGWLGYFGIASMKTTTQRWDEWLRRRYRCYIWKQWKKTKTRAQSLMQLGIPE